MFRRRVASSRSRRSTCPQQTESLESRTLLTQPLPAGLLADLNTDIPGGRPSQIVSNGALTYFAISHLDDGFPREVWRTDGTEAGTIRLRGGNIFYELTVTEDGTLFFREGTELWKSDGTVAGTTMVKSGLSGITQMIPTASSRVAFVASTTATGAELWFSDGTEAGTTVRDLRPGSTGSTPRSLTMIDGGALVFTADDGTHGREPWLAFFTINMLKDINPGTGSSMSENARFVATSEALYFSATDGTNGYELWRSEGDDSDTLMVQDIRAGSSSALSSSADIAVIDDTVYFPANNGSTGYELWKSDGTAGGTSLIRDIFPGSTASNPFGLTVIDDELYFRARASDGYEPWKSDGTTAGTVQIADVNPGGSSSSPFNFGRVNGKTLFYANDGIHGTELWETDGTEAGTKLFKDINPGSAGSPYGANAEYGSWEGNSGEVYFGANDGVHGIELWRTQGTADTTVLARDFVTGVKSSNPEDAITHDGKVYFKARTGFSNDVLITNGSTIDDFSFFQHMEPFVELNGETFFLANGDLRKFTSNGSVTQVKGLSSGQNLTVSGGKLYFTEHTTGFGRELWVSDGTFAGTVRVKDINPGSGASNAFNLTDVNGTLFFAATDGTNGFELWKSDGTEAGTVLVEDIRPGSSSSISSSDTWAAIGSNLFFPANDNSFGKELWISNGTEAGTFLIKDLNPGSTGSIGITDVVALNGFVYYEARDENSGYEVWRANGSPTATELLRDINRGSDHSYPDQFRSFGDKFVFTAESDVTGREVYISDGTTGGTTVIHDVNLGLASSDPTNLTVSGGKLFFAADNGTTGSEPWMSDGTAAGTRLIADVIEGSGSSDPGSFAFAESTIFFAADTADHGREPWVVQHADYGDAPAPYPTLHSDNGARHDPIDDGPRLGNVTREFEGQPSGSADADAEDDGITFVTGMTPGRPATINATLAGSPDAFLDAWVDFNGDGDWSDFGEHIIASGALTAAAGGTDLTFLVPAGAAPTDATFARFRVTSLGGVQPTGFASDGEVEDYAVSVNAPPIAVDDEVSAWAGQTTSVSQAGGVLANDHDIDDSALTARVISDPTHGSVALRPDGSFEYRPNTGFTGRDTFVYEAADGNGGTSTAHVILNVQPVVTAVDDFFIAVENSSRVLPILNNDSGAGDLQIVGFESAPNADVRDNGDGTLQFTPDSGFSAVTGFEYTVALKQTADTPAGPFAVAASDEYGSAVGVSGEYAIVSSPYYDGTDTDTGAVAVYRRNGAGWTLIQTLTPADVSANDRFGTAAAISGNTIVVGSPRDDDRGNNAGAAYVFELNPSTGLFQEGPKLTDPDGKPVDLFGEAVAIDRSTIVIGARLDDGQGTNSGSIFIYNRNRGGKNQWGLRKRIKPDDISGGDQFGYAVDIEGSHIIVGARNDDDIANNSGGAYILRRHAGGPNNYGEVAKLAPSDINGADQFGTTVAISGRHAAVGTPVHAGTGAAWVFDRNAGGLNNWGTETRLGTDIARSGDDFASTVAIDGTTIVIGLRTHDAAGSNAGAARVYRSDPETDMWQPQRTLFADDAQNGDQFGHAVGVSGTTVVSGAPREDTAGNNAGRAYFNDLNTSTAVATVTVASPLRATTIGTAAGPLNVTSAQLRGLTEVAEDRWGVSADVSFADLRGDLLGLAFGTTVLLDTDAAGHGWFVDPTPLNRTDDSPGNRVDLLSVVAHEVGHVAGRQDTYADEDRGTLMYGYLAPGELRALDSLDADAVFADALNLFGE